MSLAALPPTPQELLPGFQHLGRKEIFDSGMFILEQSIQKNQPLLAQLVTWRNSVDIFREQEKRDSRDLYQDSDHRSALSVLIGLGETLLYHAQQQGLKLEDIGFTSAMVESEIRALRDDMRITHEDLISEAEASEILGALSHA